MPRKKKDRFDYSNLQTCSFFQQGLNEDSNSESEEEIPKKNGEINYVALMDKKKEDENVLII